VTVQQSAGLRRHLPPAAGLMKKLAQSNPGQYYFFEIRNTGGKES
jgi:hypothetical protein